MMPSASPRSASVIRNESRFAVLKALLTMGSATRQQLTSATTLSTATVANVVTELLDAGVVHAVGKGSSIGRPSTRLSISEKRATLIGVDVAETYVDAECFDLALTQIGAATVQLDDLDNNPDSVIAGVAQAVRRAMAVAGIVDADMGGLGVSLPGQVIPSTGVSVFAPNWAWHQVKFRELLEPELALGVGAHVDNPLKAVAVAEVWLGPGAPDESTVVVNLGTGVGVGFSLAGKLIRGRGNTAGEWGHTLAVHGGRACRCGRLGCVEAYIGVPGMQVTLAEIDPDHPALALHQTDFIASVVTGLEASDPACEALMERTTDWLTGGLGDLVNLLNPDRIVLTGWMFRALGRWLLPMVQARLAAEPLTALNGLEVTAMSLRGNPVSLGMAIFALEDFLAKVGVPSRVAGPGS